MRRQLAITALVAAFLATPMWGQMHAARGFGATAGRPSSGLVSHGPVIVSRAPAVVAPRIGTRAVNGLRQPFFFSNRFHHRRLVFGTIPWGYYPGFYYNYPGYFADYSYSVNPYPAYSNTYYDQNSEIQQQEIDRLEGEVEHLREEREARAAPPQNTQPPMQAEKKPEAHQPTLLVFRDKHTQEVENYAIVGQTLWVFNEQRATKSPLSSLDVDATTKANEDRGVEFRVPQ